MIIEQMARELGLPLAFVESLARGASHEYKQYKIAKRTGGTRTIFHPSRRLKALQRWLLQNILWTLPIHDAAVAYRVGKSIYDNAARHVGSRFLLRMDFVGFFQSITVVDIARYISDHPHLFANWTTQDIDYFCKLVCRKGSLTIGAPTSPALSNVLCYELDMELTALAAGAGVTYSRYADDLFFSTSTPNVLQSVESGVMPVLRRLRVPSSLKINSTKTRHSSKRGARRVTGIVLGSDSLLHVGRTRKRAIRALIHKLDNLDNKQRSMLAGMIAFVVGFDPDFVNALIKKYGLKRVRDAMTMPESK